MALLCIILMPTLIFLGVCVDWCVSFYRKVRVSKGLVHAATAYRNLSQNYSLTLLVLGDSTGVGVGAEKPEDSIAGLLAQGMHATYTENHAVSGAIVSDVFQQYAQAQRTHYDTILLQIGGNDIIAFHSIRKVEKQLESILAHLTNRANRVVLMTSGNVGAAKLFPPLLRPFYHRVTLRYRMSFMRIARVYRASYIDLYEPPRKDHFLQDPYRYIAADGLHPSSAGYKLWYKRLAQTINL